MYEIVREFFSDDRIIKLDGVAHVSLFEGKNRLTKLSNYAGAMRGHLQQSQTASSTSGASTPTEAAVLFMSSAVQQRILLNKSPIPGFEVTFATTGLAIVAYVVAKTLTIYTN